MIDKYWNRFISKVEQTSTCWLWKAGKDSKGYSQFYAGKMVQGHVYSYMHFIGTVPEGKELDHICRVRSCVNPFHLEPVTHQENCIRGDKAKLQTHCKNGHEMVDSNLYIYNRTRNGFTGIYRMCKECKRQRKAS